MAAAAAAAAAAMAVVVVVAAAVVQAVLLPRHLTPQHQSPRLPSLLATSPPWVLVRCNHQTLLSQLMYYRRLRAVHRRSGAVSVVATSCRRCP
jgi:hypothetical protein